jgi:predicted Zn finger-like uncharacterized protein
MIVFVAGNLEMARNILECKECGARYDVTRRQAGSKVRCKRCRTSLKVPKKPKIRKSKALTGQSGRGQEKASKRLEADPKADPMDLRSGELVQGIELSPRLDPVKGMVIINSFVRMLKETFGRLVTSAIIVLASGLFVSIFILLAIGSVVNDGVRALQIILGLLALLSMFGILIIQASTMFLGSKVLRGEDDLNLELSVFKRSMSGAWKVLAKASRVFWKLLLLEAVFYFSVIFLALGTYGATLLPGVLAEPLSILAFIVLGLGTTLSYLVVNIAMVGVTVENRPMIFSLRRAYVLLTSAFLPVLHGLFVYALISAVLIFLLRLMALIGFGVDIANGFSAIASRALLGLFATAVHFELTKDEGREA